MKCINCEYHNDNYSRCRFFSVMVNPNDDCTVIAEKYHELPIDSEPF